MCWSPGGGGGGADVVVVVAVVDVLLVALGVIGSGPCAGSSTASMM